MKNHSSLILTLILFFGFFKMYQADQKKHLTNQDLFNKYCQNSFENNCDEILANLKIEHLKNKLK